MGAGKQAPSTVRQVSLSAGFDCAPQQCPADCTSANRDHNLVGAGGLFGGSRMTGLGCLGYVPGIDQPIADFRCERKALFERDESGIAMNQHEIEVIANPIDDLLGTPRVARQNYDVAQRTKNERPGKPRPGGFDQPIKLKTKRPAAN